MAGSLTRIAVGKHDGRMRGADADHDEPETDGITASDCVIWVDRVALADTLTDDIGASDARGERRDTDVASDAQACASADA